jgi:hypothetical protein
MHNFFLIHLFIYLSFLFPMHTPFSLFLNFGVQTCNINYFVMVKSFAKGLVYQARLYCTTSMHM